MCRSYHSFKAGTNLLSMVDVCVKLLYTVGKIDTSTKKFFWGTCNAKIEIRILALQGPII